MASTLSEIESSFLAEYPWTVISSGNESAVISRAVHEDTLPVWELEFYPASKTEADNIEGYFDTEKGGAGRVTWTPPGGSPTTFVFADDALTIERESATAYRINLQLQEVK